MLKKRPKTFTDCLLLARKKFDSYFAHNILQLLYTYPLTHKTKDGLSFWTLPKRAPNQLIFDKKNELHVQFITSFACLWARIWNVKIEFQNVRDSKVRAQMVELCESYVEKKFVPDDKKKLKNMSIADKKTEPTEAVDEIETEEITEQDKEQLSQLKSNEIVPEEFEKDNDQNFHIDFIHAMANLRCQNYQLDEMDWVSVKLKAGRIIPALATTTAAIAGLQAIELVKVVKNCSLDTMKNAFLNLAVPLLQLTEPGPMPVFKIHEKLSVNLWNLG